ncbi:MAG: IS200/IS605 family transposase [Atopobium sp.]|nr:IS200/IS605 family transposase [Atopobium sp.]
MKITDNGYYVNQHSCFLLQYHLVLVTKYRHPVLTGKLEEYLIGYTRKYFKDRGIVIKEINTNLDHMHILFDAPPQVNLAEFINAYKSASSRMIRKLYSEELKEYYWKPYFWSLSYFLGTVSDRSEEAVRIYIRNQKD